MIETNTLKAARLAKAHQTLSKFPEATQKSIKAILGDIGHITESNIMFSAAVDAQINPENNSVELFMINHTVSKPEQDDHLFFSARIFTDVTAVTVRQHDHIIPNT